MNSPEFSSSTLANMPIHAITETLGTEGLLDRLDFELRNLSFESQDQIGRAYRFAMELHEDDARQREPYINHLLRVALRLKVYYMIDNPDVIAAALLHDSVEDHADAINGNDSTDKCLAVENIARQFNPRVADIVEGVTNPDFDPNLDVNQQYLEHLSSLAEYDDPWPLILKLSDFTDNATGLIYTPGKKFKKLAIKYYPAIVLFENALLRPDLPLSDSVIEHIKQQLKLTRERLQPAWSAHSARV